MYSVLIKPWHMCKGYDSIPGLYILSEAAYSFLQAFEDLYCVDFTETFLSMYMYVIKYYYNIILVYYQHSNNYWTVNNWQCMHFTILKID